MAVAAAVLGQAGVIVTDNLKHFPKSKMPAGVDVKTARDFLADAVDINPELALRVIMDMSRRYMNPRLDIHDILEVLASRYQAVEAVEMLREVLDVAH